MANSYRPDLARRFQAVRQPLRKLVDALEDRWSTLKSKLTASAPPTAAELQHADEVWSSRVTALAQRPLISIIMPTYNTPERWLRRAVASVRQQYYPHWELCIVDDGSADQTVDRVLDELSAADCRVRVFKQQQNQGISSASNIAVENCRGEFIALFDHDDELTRDALYYVAETLAARPDADIIYSDEAKIDRRGVVTEPFLKPDWSPELLFNYMYSGHLTVYRKTLIERAGGFRTEYDFSQDYDLMLRAVELTQAILHIPRVLYYWRKAEGSAANSGGKLFARTTNLAALQAALDRRGIAADVRELPTANKLCFRSPAQPMVSLIIPSDSEVNIAQSLLSIDKNTQYPALEIIVVTSSALADKLGNRFRGDARVRFQRFDKPFNFSQKCNEGVAVSTGEIVVFFNDDVRPLSCSWVADLIEYLALPGVGAVAPKLLYENGTIQHAGLVTGVRGLVGTAFHVQPADSLTYFNFAQIVRDVSALSGACLAMRRELCSELGGFDAEHFPINHSDVDLCFRIRERGLRCVYTPYTALLHIGHGSLGEFEKKQDQRHRDKADVELLKRWAGFTAADPYYTAAMRDLLYVDSPGPIAIYGKDAGKDERRSYPLGVDALFISHELTDSGAPLVLFNALQAFVQSGGFAVVLSPSDGPFRARFTALGVPVICDSRVFSSPELQRKLISGFDVVVANTLVCWPLLSQAESVQVPVLWYLHESSTIDEWIAKVPGFRDVLRGAAHVIVGSYRSLQHCLRVNPRAQVLPYGVAEFAHPVPRQDKIIVSVLASLESRKGQDIFVRAVQALDESARQRAEFWIVGRPLKPIFAAEVKQLTEQLPCVRFLDPVSLERYQEILLCSDVIVCPSRDDTLPLVSLDALGCGKALVVSSSTGTMDFITHGKQGLVFSSEDSAHLALCLQRLIEEPALRQSLGRAGRELFLQKFSLRSFHQRFVAHLLSVVHTKSTPLAAAHLGAAV